jgi:formyltetrahydrofolate synthetase
MENEKNNNQLQIELKEEVAQGTYANLAIITHSSSEFIVDFVRVMPGLPKEPQALHIDIVDGEIEGLS